MEDKTAEHIFSGQRYWKLEEYSHKLSEGKTRVEFRRALRENLNAAVRSKADEKGKKELRAGLHRAVSLLQVFVFKSIFSDELDLEKMIPETAHRRLIWYILNPDQGDSFSSVTESAIKSALREPIHAQSLAVNQSLADNLHEIVLVVQGIIDEL